LIAINPVLIVEFVRELYCTQQEFINVELKELKILFDNGGLKTITIKRAPLMNGYILITETVNKNVHVMTSQREESNTPRAFKTIDAAAANAKKVGFMKITIDLN